MLNSRQAALGITAEVYDAAEATEERITVPQATALVAALSLALWTVIGLGVRWLIG
jgi:hypothetical protein